jgi:Ca2+-binding RTX toxin-like protein
MSRAGCLFPRRGVPLAVAFAATALLASTAQAGSVSVVGGVMTFTETGTEPNNVSVWVDGTGYRLADSQPLALGSGCTQTGGIATCVGVTGVNISTGNHHDAITIGPSVSIGTTLDGGFGTDNVTGGPGPDTLYGRGGNDTLDGGPGDDRLFGGPGVIGPDQYNTYRCEEDPDVLRGGDGTDVADYSDRAHVNVSINGVADDGSMGACYGYNFVCGCFRMFDYPEDDNVATDVENLRGSPTPDTLTGSAAANELDGGGGGDTLDGQGGPDTLIGGDGWDTMQGGAGMDWLTGEEGNDTLDGGPDSDELEGGIGDDLFKGGASTCSASPCLPSRIPADTMTGGLGTDTVSYAAYTANVYVDLGTGDGGAGGSFQDVFSDVEWVVGGSGNDILRGNDLPNSMSGGPGNDSITGFAGADAFDGGPGSDAIDSRDTTAETPTCGADADTLRRDTQDTIGSGCEAYSPRSTGTPTITGTPTEGQTLAAAASWEAAPAPTQTYQWRRCTTASASSCTNASTASSLTLTAADVGFYFRVAVTGTNFLGDDSGESGSTAQVARAAPVSQAAPTITGAPRRGSTLTASPGLWTSSESPTLTYAWERCASGGSCAPIEAATSSTYVLQPADVNQTLLVAVTAANSGGSQTARSERTATIADLDTTAPDTVISSAPPATTSDRSASIVFSATEAGSTFQCSLDGAAFAACASPITYSSLAVGAHTFHVKATDAAGNTDASPATASWTITEIVAPPPPPVVQCKVPPLKGKTLMQTKAALKKANCALGKVSRAFSTRAKKGKVLKQSPAAGRTLAKGAKVAVTLGKGPRP